MKVIGYFTPGYATEAELLVRSLDRVGMEHEITSIESRGNWYANTSYKPMFLRERRATMTGPLLYLDVDAFVHHNCTAYFEELAARHMDFGAHWYAGPAKGYDWSRIRRDAMGNLNGWWMLSGTLFLGDTLRCRRLLFAWCAINETLQQCGVMEGGGQKNLWFLTTCMEDLRVERLPGRYCYVFDKERAYPDTEPRIIEHTIASRDHRAVERQTPARQSKHREFRKILAFPYP